MPYNIAVTSGLWGIQRPQWLLGLAKKMSSVTTYGVNWVQADIETSSTAELFEPNFVDGIVRAKDDLGINWGMHGELGSTMAWESAVGLFWVVSHRKLHQYLDQLYQKFVKPGRKKYRPAFIDFHISNDITMGFLLDRFRRAGYLTVDFNGREDWSKLIDKHRDLEEWFTKNVLPVILAREVPTLNLRDIKQYEESQRYAWWKEITSQTHGVGRILIEEIAYIIIAKYLELKKNDPYEPLWKIFFPTINSMGDLEKKWGKKLIDPVTGEFYLHPDIVAMVGERYIIGHFETPIQDVLY